jgi:hypothetical protein
MNDRRLYGLLAEFPGGESLLEAARRARERGYRSMDAFTPFPVEGLSEALGHRRSLLPWIVLAGAISGGLAGYGLQLYLTLFHYPINVGGRPLHSWPAFIPITFELAVLGGALAAVLGMLALNRLPTPYHPLFAAPGFERATQNGFFFCLEAADPLFDRSETRRFLHELGPVEVIEVEA